MPFEKGQSGNPEGRKKGALNRSTKQMREFIRESVDFAEMVEKLVALAREGDLTAIKMLFQYGYGNPQSVTDCEKGDEWEEGGLSRAIP
jgi:hypothetical protein